MLTRSDVVELHVLLQLDFQSTFDPLQKSNFSSNWDDRIVGLFFITTTVNVVVVVMLLGVSSCVVEIDV